MAVCAIHLRPKFRNDAQIFGSDIDLMMQHGARISRTVARHYHQQHLDVRFDGPAKYDNTAASAAPVS